MITLPLERLRKNGVLADTAPVSPPKVPGIDKLHSVMKDLATARQGTQEGPKSFPQRYKERQAQLAEKLKERMPAIFPPQSFVVARPVRFTDGTLLPAESLSQGNDGAGWLLKTSKSDDEQAVPLTFKGVKYTHDIKDAKLSPNEACYLVSKNDKEMFLYVPDSPDKLEVQDPRPSPLYRWYVQQRQSTHATASKPTSPAPSPE